MSGPLKKSATEQLREGEMSSFTESEPGKPKNPRRVAAGRRNRAQRGPLTAAGLERLRAAAYQHQPWRLSTGPRTSAGRTQSAANGRARQQGPISVRMARAHLAAIRELLRSSEEFRRPLEP
jgi:hypothetical protein